VYPIPSLWLVAIDYISNSIQFPINDQVKIDSIIDNASETRAFSLKTTTTLKVKSYRAKNPEPSKEKPIQDVV